MLSRITSHDPNAVNLTAFLDDGYGVFLTDGFTLVQLRWHAS